MQKGFRNELDFKDLMDNKKINELPENLEKLIRSIFTNVNPDSLIECWQSKYYEKADLKVRINDTIKGISIKSGINCSMHQENINKFYKFLEKIGADSKIIEIFNNYMIGKVNGKRVSASIYIEENIKDIQILNEFFNDYYVKVNLIIRFIFQGTEIQKYGCDAIIHGTPDNFLWATRNEIIKYLLEYEPIKDNSINVSAMYIKAYDRNLRNDMSRIKCQEEIQVKWPKLIEVLRYVTILREAKKMEAKIMNKLPKKIKN